MHNLRFTSSLEGSNFEDAEDGGLIVRNVIAMAPGNWTSMEGTKTMWSVDVLKKRAGKWEQDSGLFSRHQPRSTTTKIGAILTDTARYVEGKGAVVDVYLHRATTQSIDVAKAMRIPANRGGLTDVSAEVRVDLDRDGNVTDMTFTGLAVVERGACVDCKIPAFGAGGEETKMADNEKTPPAKGEDEKKDTLLSVARDILKSSGMAAAADLIDIALTTEDEAAKNAIIAKLKELAPKEPEAAPVADIAPFSKMLDEKLAQFGVSVKTMLAESGKASEASFGKALVGIEAKVEKIASKTDGKMNSHTDFGEQGDGRISFEEDSLGAVRNRRRA